MNLTCIKEVGLLNVWADSLSVALLDNHIHLVGSAINAIVPSNDHYVFDQSGNRIAFFNGNFTTRGEAGISNIIPGKLILIGGTTRNDVWRFDPAINGNNPSSWVQHNIDFSWAIGPRIMAGHIDANGWHYIIGGWNKNDVYRTQTFLDDWEFVCTLPEEAESISAAGITYFNGLIYLIGGGTNMANGLGSEFYNGQFNGRVFTLNPSTGEFLEIYQNQDYFGQAWVDAASTDNYIYVSMGLIPQEAADQYPEETLRKFGRNQRGLLRSADGIVWEELPITDGLAMVTERHRCGMIGFSDHVLLMAGYNCNDMWRIDD